MIKAKTLAYVPYGTGQVRPFDAIFKDSFGVQLHNLVNLKNADALIIWGGADISPSIYGEEVSKMTGAGKQLSARDQYEVTAVQAAIKYGIPLIGICRGAQLLCAMAGGKLVQHVDNHGRSHNVTTSDGRTMETSSVHHQMMYPWDIEHKLLAWSSEKRSPVYIGGDDKDMEHLHMGYVEPEVVFFPKINGLAIQGHPEFMNPNDEFVQYCLDLVEELLLTQPAQETADANS